MALKGLEDYFKDYNQREDKGVYFYRITKYNEVIRNFIEKYFEAARISGVWIERRIPNPDERNLSYYDEIMGMEFRMDKTFIQNSLKKWLPRLDETQRMHVAEAIYQTLDKMKQEGKNENMLKNAYIKFMCWMYYKFERILMQLGKEKLPKILYEGIVSNYELKMLCILAYAGCDIVLLQYNGDSEYLKLDSKSQFSKLLVDAAETKPFPQGFSVRNLQKEMAERSRIAAIYGKEPNKIPCTNIWISGNPWEDILKNPSLRGEDARFFYNCFLKVRGVEDKTTYLNQLLQLYLQLKDAKRQIVIEEKEITPPTMEEIGKIQRSNYDKLEQMFSHLLKNIQYTASFELQQQMKKYFIELILEESKKDSQSASHLNRLTNKSVYLLCWLKRYQEQLFKNWKEGEISVFLFLGTCKNENEALFFRFLARLPVDVVIFSPNLDAPCILQDDRLIEKNYELSMNVEVYPKENSEIRMGTAAFHAEQDLNSMLYDDTTGLYRNQQYSRAMAVSLQTMYEEIEILWGQEAKYRPNFGIIDGQVTLPVIFAKVCGVKDGNKTLYWQEVKKLVTEDTYVVTKVPFVDSRAPNPMKQYAAEFFKNGKVQKKKIKEHSAYPYGYLREEIQDYILEKMQLLIDQKVIKGTFVSGAEYTIVSTILNLDKNIVRLIQKIDFTKVLPKMIFIDTNEAIYSLEDSIIAGFLNLIGFDIVFFVPTGYQNIEKHFIKSVLVEHQIGEYMYDMQVPHLKPASSGNLLQSWRERIFGKN